MPWPVPDLTWIAVPPAARPLHLGLALWPEPPGRPDWRERGRALSRTALRAAWRRATGTEADAATLTEPPAGTGGLLLGGPTPWSASVAYRPGAALVAIAAGTAPLGVDLEAEGNPAAHPWAEDALALFGLAPTPAQGAAPPAALRLWTRHEAVAKALRCGLPALEGRHLLAGPSLAPAPLRAWTPLDVAPPPAPSTPARVTPAAPPPLRLLLLDLPLPPGWSGAVACALPPPPPTGE